jgi:hypothetical protein
LSQLFPGNRGMIARQDFTDLRESTLITFFQLCPPEIILQHHKTDHRIVLRTPGPPSEIIYRGLGEESAMSEKAKKKAKSIELGWMLIDEASEVSFEAYKQLLAQLCWRLPNGSRPPYMAMLMSNPEPGWVKDRFVDKNSADCIIGKADAAFIPFLPKDNPGLPDNWEKNLRDSMDADWCKRYLDGSWEIHEGMVFTELSDEYHNLDRFIDPTDAKAWSQFIGGFRHVASLDHASTGITAYLRAGVDTSENLVAFEEHYEADQLISHHAERIKSLDKRYPKPDYRLIDPSTESDTLQNKDEMYSVQDAYFREGVPTMAAFRSEIHIGIDRIKELLHWNPTHIHPFLQQRGSPRLFISRSRCPSGWKEMVNLKKKLMPNGSVVFVGPDHFVDDLRYIAMSRPGAAKEKEADIKTLPSAEQFAIRAHQKWAQSWGQQGKGKKWF